MDVAKNMTASKSRTKVPRYEETTNQCSEATGAALAAVVSLVPDRTGMRVDGSHPRLIPNSQVISSALNRFEVS